MECREPLYWTPPQNQKPAPVLGNPGLNNRPGATSRYGGPRGRYSPGPQTPPQASISTQVVKEEPVQLPLPKNVVLMGMIEAANRQKKMLAEGRKRNGGTNGEGDDMDDSGKNKSKVDPVLAGVNALVGTCGTYVVREPLGLAVLPFDPKKERHLKKCGDEEKEESEEKKAEVEREPFTIEKGQRVQVIGVNDGVYQLARDSGFIVASVNQLVKVGGPVEESCQYEGMLQSVEKKQDTLQRELDEINILVDGLKEKIEIVQEHPAEHPIITPLELLEEHAIVNDENDATSGAIITSPSTPNQNLAGYQHHSPGDMHITDSTSSTEVNLGAPRTPAQSASTPDRYADSPAHSCPIPGAVMNPDLSQPFMDVEPPAGLLRYRVNTDDDHNLPWSFGCGTGLFGERLLEPEVESGNVLPRANGNVMAMSFDENLVGGNVNVQQSRDSPARSLAARTMASSYPSPGEGHLRSASGSFDGPINFRTGMSGHTGLSLSRKKNSPLSRPHIRMMSEHRGIAASSSHHRSNGQQNRRPHAMAQYMD